MIGVGARVGRARAGVAPPTAWQPPAPGNILSYGTVEMLSESNGTGIASWGTPVAMTQATAAAQPTKQADYVFVGADDFLEAPANSLHAPELSVIFVAKIPIPAVNRLIFKVHNSGQVITLSDGRLLWRRFNAADQQRDVVTPGDFRDGLRQTICVTYSTAESKIFVNGSSLATQDNFDSALRSSTELPRLSGVFSELIAWAVYNKPLSVAEQAEWGAKWQ